MKADLGIVHDKFVLENSGLVLLWPFLPQLFQQLNLLKDKRFNSEAEALHAVGLLEYLVNGHKDILIGNLFLNKLLCNIPYNYQIEKPKILTIAEAEECDTLLNNVISNWKAFKNTSIDGLRHTFLKRRGELQLEEKAVLKIEACSIDVLLDSLPWNISIINLPWMDIALYVDWI